MADKNNNDSFGSERGEFDGIHDAMEVFLTLFDERITAWEKIPPDKENSGESKFRRVLLSTRFNALDAVNLQLKKKIAELGGRVPSDD